MKHMGRKLKAAREYLDLSEKAVTLILRLPDERLGFLETQKTIKLKDLQPLLKLYGLTMEEFFKNEPKVNGLENLSQKDKKEVINLIKLKDELKERDCRNECN